MISVWPQIQATNTCWKILDEYKKRDAEKSTTLNEATLKQQREADDQKTFERNNLKTCSCGFACA
jgi:hypothetical protein